VLNALRKLPQIDLGRQIIPCNSPHRNLPWEFPPLWTTK